MKDLFKAWELQRNGHHTAAAAILQREANKERPPQEKQELWKQAENARKNALRD